MSRFGSAGHDVCAVCYTARALGLATPYCVGDLVGRYTTSLQLYTAAEGSTSKRSLATIMAAQQTALTADLHVA